MAIAVAGKKLYEPTVPPAIRCVALPAIQRNVDGRQTDYVAEGGIFLGVFSGSVHVGAFGRVSPGGERAEDEVAGHPVCDMRRGLARSDMVHAALCGSADSDVPNPADAVPAISKAMEVSRTSRRNRMGSGDCIDVTGDDWRIFSRYYAQPVRCPPFRSLADSQLGAPTSEREATPNTRRTPRAGSLLS